jgi:hypothetical protein
MQDNNKFIIPEDVKTKRGCPKCGCPDFVGRNVMGVVTWTCKNSECGNKWSGGLPQVPLDPTKPHPPVDPADRPTLEFVKDGKGQMHELRRSPNPTQDFRKGAPIPTGEEDV